MELSEVVFWYLNMGFLNCHPWQGKAGVSPNFISAVLFSLCCSGMRHLPHTGAGHRAALVSLAAAVQRPEGEAEAQLPLALPREALQPKSLFFFEGKGKSRVVLILDTLFTECTLKAAVYAATELLIALET